MANTHATLSSLSMRLAMRGKNSSGFRKSVTWQQSSLQVLPRPVVRHHGESITTSTYFRRSIMSSSSSPPPQRQPPARGPEQPTASIEMEEWDDFSAERKIQWLLNTAGDTKWGLVIYRTCYKPEFDTVWESFKAAVVATARRRVAKSDAPDIADKMDWVFIEDQAHLDGAVRPELKRRFRDWARAENPGWDIDEEQHSRGSRYSFFIEVDGAALLSMAAAPNVADTAPSDGRPYVNIVRGWEDTEGVEDWMKIQTDMLEVDFYVELNNDEAWYVFYTPPSAVYYH